MTAVAQKKSALYVEAVGRRKTASARLRFFAQAKDKQAGKIVINDKELKDYFPMSELQATVLDPLVKVKAEEGYFISVKVKGGGIRGQAEAVRHGTARVLVDFNINFKKRLRKVGYLTRDPRMRERKKFGLKKIIN